MVHGYVLVVLFDYQFFFSGMSYIKFPDFHTFLFYLFCKRYANFKGTKSVSCFYTKVLDLRLSSFFFVFRNSSMCGDI